MLTKSSLKEIAETGGTPCRGSNRQIPADKIHTVQCLLKEEEFTMAQIAQETGVSQSTVRRERDRLAK